jgi:curved DNA-binding protein CbpA
MKNYYTILQIPEDSNRDDIQTAYRRLAKQYHPDVNKSSDAHERFCEITEAYEFLMNHWPLHVDQYANRTSYEQKYDDYRKTADYDRFRQEAQERARQQAKMRYEKFRKQHEAFQESGIDDIVLLFKVFIRIVSVPLFLLLLLLPGILILHNSWRFLFLATITWPLAGLLTLNFYNKRKDYFIPGKFYYSLHRIKHLYTDINPSGQRCFYCPYKIADSKPFKLDLLRLKDIKMGTGGFRQQSVNYLNQSISIIIPRSRKAFIIHSIVILIKLTSLITCMVFLNISSLVWRFIIGMVLGGASGNLLLIISRTRSNVTYLLSYGFMLRVIIWIFCLIQVTWFYSNPIDIVTNDLIHLVIAAIVLFDSFLMQLINLILGRYASKPIRVQFPETTKKFSEGYLVYNDIPVISVVYPVFKWIFG